MSADRSFDELMARLRGGDQDAARCVFHRFADRLVGLAHRRLTFRVRPKVGAEDVVQSAFETFFRRCAEGDFDLGGWDSLWALLALITVRKCGREVKRFHGPCHDVRREFPAGGADGGWDVLSREPPPAEAALRAETVEQFLRGLGERERQIAELRLLGHTVPEISTRVERTDYTVEGVLKKVRKRLRHLRDAETDAR